MRQRASLFHRSLEPLAASLWTLFVLLSVLVGFVWTFDLGDAALERWVSHGDLRTALRWLLQRIDLLWFTLGAANSYLALAAREGLPTARRWGLTILFTVVALAWLSVRSGVPFGPLVFGETLGFRLGPVPLGLPLFWFTVILGAREAVLYLRPRFPHAAVAVSTGLLAAVTDFHLEPLAAKLRAFLFWPATVAGEPPMFDAPPHTSLAWGLLAGLLTFFLREQSVVTSARSRAWQPAWALLIFHFVFAAAHLGRWTRN